ncbi:hypothetical protein PISMIDRAFT_683068 [Pisolithus microcarpus 441]|uniref:Uncharacterized protein n=1 Tax=Pisolithus microcarpus 441 TaxID=765257 RepID=A0A0C9YQE9_9AGAM|nr:hypothetical protein PISMIDRAFT_689358 [Pisolithus microcarpus 441]KIK19574.1 hypothetical protein PISMIDRAFT_683068 [Pisolithus microcarpus 441]
MHQGRTLCHVKGHLSFTRVPCVIIVKRSRQAAALHHNDERRSNIILRDEVRWRGFNRVDEFNIFEYIERWFPLHYVAHMLNVDGSFVKAPWHHTTQPHAVSRCLLFSDPVHFMTAMNTVLHTTISNKSFGICGDGTLGRLPHCQPIIL